MTIVLRIAFGFLIALSLAGCASGPSPAQQERASAMQQSQEALARCEARYPKKDSNNLVVASRCIGDAIKIRRPYMAYPDLFDADYHAMIAAAEKVQYGKMTLAEFLAERAKSQSYVVAETQRRDLLNRSVRAQETTAAAATEAASHYCTGGGMYALTCQ